MTPYFKVENSFKVTSIENNKIIINFLIETDFTYDTMSWMLLSCDPDPINALIRYCWLAFSMMQPCSLSRVKLWNVIDRPQTITCCFSRCCLKNKLEIMTQVTYSFEKPSYSNRLCLSTSSLILLFCRYIEPN